MANLGPIWAPLQDFAAVRSTQRGFIGVKPDGTLYVWGSMAGSCDQAPISSPGYNLSLTFDRHQRCASTEAATLGTPGSYVTGCKPPPNSVRLIGGNVTSGK